MTESTAQHLAALVLVSLFWLLVAFALTAFGVLDSPWPATLWCFIVSALMTVYHIWRDR